MRLFKILPIFILLTSCSMFQKSKQEKLKEDVVVCAKSVSPLIYQMGGQVSQMEIIMYCIEILQNDQVMQYKQPARQPYQSAEEQIMI
jgi:hypothetical protein